jgi:glutathione peroxidase-family protein
MQHHLNCLAWWLFLKAASSLLPGCCSDIKAFAKKSYGVTFPLMGKVDVNGGGADPLFKW